MQLYWLDAAINMIGEGLKANQSNQDRQDRTYTCGLAVVNMFAN